MRNDPLTDMSLQFENMLKIRNLLEYLHKFLKKFRIFPEYFFTQAAYTTQLGIHICYFTIFLKSDELKKLVRGFDLI